MNKRWVYSCVQNLLSFELQPGLLLDGRVERLRMSEQSQDGEEEDDNRRRIRSNSTSAPSSSSATLLDHGSSGDFGDDDGMDIDYEVDDDDGDVIMSIEQADDGDSDQGSKGKSIMVTPTKKKLSSPDSAPVAKKKEPKTPWTEDDIKRMITLKDFEGFTHEEVAVRTHFQLNQSMHKWPGADFGSNLPHCRSELVEERAPSRTSTVGLSRTTSGSSTQRLVACSQVGTAGNVERATTRTRTMLMTTTLMATAKKRPDTRRLERSSKFDQQADAQSRFRCW